jgi:hypothetical protein
MSVFKGTPNLSGRPKDAKNKINTIAKELIMQQLDGHLNRIDEYFNSVSNPATKLKLLAEFMPYILPRLKQQEIELNHFQTPEQITVNIVN